MERVNITIGPVTFDRADYDAENDVLYLNVGEPQGAEGEETPEGHVLRYAPVLSGSLGSRFSVRSAFSIEKVNCGSPFPSRLKRAPTIWRPR